MLLWGFLFNFANEIRNIKRNSYDKVANIFDDGVQLVLDGKCLQPR